MLCVKSHPKDICILFDLKILGWLVLDFQVEHAEARAGEHSLHVADAFKLLSAKSIPQIS